MHLLTAMSLRVAAAGAALLAAWGPALPAGDAPRLRVLVQDVSASVGDAALDGSYPDGFTDGLGGGDRVAVVLFGEGAHLVDGPRKLSAAPGRAVAPPGRGASDLAAALRKSATLATGPSASLEVWLRTDGRPTDAARELVEAATELRAAGCVALRVLELESVAFPAVVTELRGPGRAPVGGLFALEARGRSAGGASVELLREGQAVASREVAASGPFRLVFTRTEAVPGPVRYEARISGSAIPAAAAHVSVIESRGAVVLTPGAVRPALRTALGRPCTAAAPVDDPGRLAVLFGSHDLVVLDGVRATTLPKAVSDALDAHARRGGGLLLLGGPDGFGAGGWAGRPLDALSPLRSEPDGEEGLLLYVALDGSGSMGRRWEDAGPDERTRDVIVRAAAGSLIRQAADDTALVLRRFADRLLPTAAPPAPIVLDARGKEAAARALRALPEPGGGTALLPVLAEALELSRSAGRARRQALVFTDGRTSEDAGALRAAVAALTSSGCALTVVLPADADESGARAALADSAAVLVDAGAAEGLAAVFRDVEARARVDEPFLDARALRARGPAERVLRGEIPARAERLNRTWAADDATVLVVTDTGEPAAGMRAHGRGRVAALATRVGDADWLAGPGDAALLSGLAGAVARPPTADVRVERAPDGGLLVRASAGRVPVSVEADAGEGAIWSAPLAPAGDGLLRADPPTGQAAPGSPVLWVRVLGPEGAELAVVGLDRAAPREYRDPPSADLSGLRALAVGPAPPAGPSSRPWLAAAAVLLLLGASMLASRARPSPAERAASRSRG